MVVSNFINGECMNPFISKLVFALLGLALTCSVYAETETEDNCTSNGYPLKDVITVEKNLQSA